jgi:Na+/melibiose symporter-like transporter
MLALGIMLAVVTFPLIRDWLGSDYTAWHRPYLVWGIIVLFTWWGYRSRHPDEL